MTDYFKRNIGTLIALVISSIAYLALGYFTPRENFFNLIGWFAILFAAYGYIYYFTAKQGVGFLMIMGVLFRALLLFGLPLLSGDYFRFVWDGLLFTHGENPFLHLPSYYHQQPELIPELTDELFNGLNSPEYYTIYPPVSQYVFAFATWLFPTDILKAVITMKSVLFIAETGSIILIRSLLNRLSLSPKLALLYALNPLVIVELTGNLHFEALMIFFLLLSFHLILNNRYKRSAFTMALAISTKLLPLMILPFFIKRIGFRKSIIYFGYIALFCLILFTPFISKEFITNIFTSINLYFQKFEFNASLYYVVRWIGYQIKGWNIIQTAGPVLSAITALVIFSGAALERQTQWSTLPKKVLFAFTTYFLLATTVHPWYITTLVAFSPFGQLRYGIIWSALATLSYFAYSNNTYTENLWLITLEYTATLTWMGYELFQQRRRVINSKD